MAKLEILHYPDNRLRKKALDITIFDENTKIIANNMLETMYQEKGIGLAAIQVGIQKKIIVIDVSEERDKPIILINPEILDKKDPIVFEEGCLSVPGFYEKVDRYNFIKYKYKNLEGEEVTDTAEGLFAVCIQHEMDHLKGKLFVDYLSSIKRDRITKKIMKAQSDGITPSRKDIPYSI